VIAAATGLVGQTSQISLIELLYVGGTDRPFLMFGFLFFCSGSPVHGGGSSEGVLVVVEDVCLGSADGRVDYRRPIGGITGEEFPDEPPAAEGAEKSTSFRF
jgi:hypothetical protein